MADFVDTTPGRACTKCLLLKHPSCFGVDKRSPSQRRQSWCKDCTNAQRRERYRELYAELVTFKLERGCIDCGYREHPAALQFDHRPDEVKLGDVARLVNSSPAVLWAEVAKCDVRCANCHAVKTAERRQELASV